MTNDSGLSQFREYRQSANVVTATTSSYSLRLFDMTYGASVTLYDNVCDAYVETNGVALFPRMHRLEILSRSGGNFAQLMLNTIKFLLRYTSRH